MLWWYPRGKSNPLSGMPDASAGWLRLGPRSRESRKLSRELMLADQDAPGEDVVQWMDGEIDLEVEGAPTSGSQ
jgi:hypothetical protein